MKNDHKTSKQIQDKPTRWKKKGRPLGKVLVLILQTNISAETMTLVEREAAAEGISRSAWVRRLIMREIGLL